MDSKDRLLADAEIVNTYYHDGISDDDGTTTYSDFLKSREYKFAIEILKAQDRKSVKAVIEEIDNQRDNVCCVGEETTLCPLADPCCSFMRKSCTWWQQFKERTLR